MKPSLILATTLTLAATATAQITYVDADAATNTTHADGTVFTPNTTFTGNDNLWQQRPFANGGTIISSNDAGTGSEDCPMLRTTITGLIPTLPYVIYGYQWNTAVDQWRLAMSVDTQQPTGPLQLWHTRGTGSPMSTPLAFDAPTNTETRLGLQYDPVTLLETTGHFANPVMLQEGNRWLFEVPLGIFNADVLGEIHVYIDDDPQAGNFNRNWYDGVGYELAPLPFGNGCGSPAPQIGFRGEPVMLRDFTIELSGGMPNALALLTFGISSPMWNGLPLPLSLAQFGYAGCDLNVNSQLNLLMLTNATGEASVTFNLSGVPSIPLDWQWGVLSPAGSLAMTTGIATTLHR